MKKHRKALLEFIRNNPDGITVKSLQIKFGMKVLSDLKTLVDQNKVVMIREPYVKPASKDEYEGPWLCKYNHKTDDMKVERIHEEDVPQF